MTKNLNRKRFNNKDFVYDRINTIHEPIFIGIQENCIFQLVEEIFKRHKLNRLIYLSPMTHKWYCVEHRMNDFLFKNVDPEHVCFHIPIEKETKSMSQNLKTRLMLLGLTDINHKKTRTLFSKITDKIKRCLSF